MLIIANARHFRAELDVFEAEEIADEFEILFVEQQPILLDPLCLYLNTGE